MNKNSKILIGIVVIVILVLVGWQLQRAPKDGSAITVGVAAAQTGDAAEWGEGELRIVQMMIDDVNAGGGIDGAPIKIVAEDTKSTGEGTVSAVNKLINIDNAAVIIGPTWADSYQGAAPIAEKAKVVLLTPSAALEVIENKKDLSYLFSTFWPQAPEIATLNGFMVKNGIKKLAIINDHDTYTTKFSDALEADAKTRGITIVDREQIPTTQNDYRTEILKMKQGAPDAIFVEITNIAGLGPFMKQVRTLGLTAKVFTTADAQNQDAVSKFGSYMEGMTYPFPVTPSGSAYKDFVDEYEAKYASLPSAPSAITTYNAVKALVEVLKEGARTGTEIRDALRKVEVLGFGTAEVSFNDLGGITTADFDIKMIKNSQFVVIPK